MQDYGNFMSQKIEDIIYTENEEIFYYLLNIIPNSKFLPEINKFWDIFKQDTSIIENINKIPNNIKKNNSLFLFLRFYHALYSQQKNKAILVLENFVNNGIYDEFYLLSILFGIKEELEIESYFEIDDQYFTNLIKSYNFIKHNEYDKAYHLLIEINIINRLSFFREILYLQCAIEKKLYSEVENIFSFLFSINKKNDSLKKLYIYYLLRKGEILSVQKFFAKNKLNYHNFNEKSLYLYNLIESKQFEKAINLLKSDLKREEEIFLLARLYHVIGLLDEAFSLYKKVDFEKYPVNKMLGIIFFQLGDYEKALQHLNEEINIRYTDTDTLKIIKYLELKKRWGNVSNSTSTNK